MPTGPSAEDRFVEAMRYVKDETYTDERFQAYVLQAIKAFADHGCGRAIGYATLWKKHQEQHVECRAKLIRRCGCEEADGR